MGIEDVAARMSRFSDTVQDRVAKGCDAIKPGAVPYIEYDAPLVFGQRRASWP